MTSDRGIILDSFDEIDIFAIRQRFSGETIVLTSGSFDLMHLGHAKYLERAHKLGTCLIVGVDSDEKLRERKGPERPYVEEEERAEFITFLRGVNAVIIKQHHWPRWALIDYVRPDILVTTEDTYTYDEVDEIEKKFGCSVVVLERQHPASSTERALAIAGVIHNKNLSVLEGDLTPDATLLDEINNPKPGGE